MSWRGISTQGFVPALAGFSGSGARPSESTIQRLTRGRNQERSAFDRRGLSAVDDIPR